MSVVSAVLEAGKGRAKGVWRHIVILFTITKRIDNIQESLDKLATVYAQLARQHNLAAQVTMENRRRMKHHESGPLAPSKVILEKKDGAQARKLKLQENGAEGVTPKEES